MSAEASNAATASADVPTSAAERLMQQHAADEAHKATVRIRPEQMDGGICGNMPDGKSFGLY